MRTAPALLLAACACLAQAQTAHRCETPEGHVSYRDHACDDARDSTAPAVSRRLEGARLRAVGVRLQALTKAADERRDATDSQSVQRCRSAMEIAALCGTTAPDFSCDHRGFVAAPVDDSARRVEVGNNRKYQMQRCARQAAQGRR